MISNSDPKGVVILKKNEDFNSVDRIDNKLLENSIHFLTGEIDEANILAAIKWVTYENIETSKHKQLTLYINSHGGDLYQAFALIDIMKSSKFPIRTIGIGSIMSAAFLIFVSGQRGNRYIAPNTGIMCHQYSDSSEGKHHDLKAAMKEGEHCNERMMGILKIATELPIAKIKSKLLPASDVYLTAQEMVDLGAADYILY
jgi:ATP-dependent Clp protease protease subunit